MVPSYKEAREQDEDRLRGVRCGRVRGKTNISHAKLWGRYRQRHARSSCLHRTLKMMGVARLLVSTTISQCQGV